MATSITPRTARVVIFQGDDEERIRELKADADRLKPDPKKPAAPRTLDEVDSHAEACEAHDAFKAEAKERAVVVVVQALRRKQWRSLVAEHQPPRPDNAGDSQLGVNLATFSEVLVAASIVEPTFDTPADRDDFLEGLSDGQHEELFWAAWGVNRSGSSDPKELLHSGSSPSSSGIAN